MGYEFFMGLRYLRARRRGTFISLITVISVLGVMIAVLTLNVVISVMAGFEEVIRDRLLGVNAHILVVRSGSSLMGYRELTERVREVPGVLFAAPTVYGQAILNSGQRLSGIVLRGIHPDRGSEVLGVERFIKEGSLGALRTPRRIFLRGKAVDLPGIILGTRLAGQLGVLVGDPVQVVSPSGIPTVLGLIPKVKRFLVVGILESGMYEYDSSLAYTHLTEAQRFFGLGEGVSGIEVRVEQVDRAGEVASRIQESLGFPFLAEDWSRLWPNLFSALRLEKTVYFLVLLLMVLIAAFNIVSTLVMVVMEKRKDIAVLQSMGATRRSIRKIFMIKGCAIGFMGTLLGVVSGYGVCLLIRRYQFIELPRDVFLVSTVPVTISAGHFALVAAASFLICLLASIYPAHQAAKLDPVEVIRYE